MTHCHTMLTNPIYFDSTANYKQYIKKVKELGMDAVAFTEHGNIYQWISKKNACDEAKIKYIHASEFYMAIDLDVQERQDFHICLYAANYEGVKELNSLSSKSFEGKGEKWYAGIQYYYRPRISFEQLKNTSDNIIVTTACLASLLWRRKDEEIATEYLEWLSQNKHRCFLEIQPHVKSEDQKLYNKCLSEWSTQYGIRMIAGTDTHVLDKKSNRLRFILQKGKKTTNEESEDGFALHMRSLDELIGEFKEQGVLSEAEYYEAINNTNVLSDMCENWTLDKSHKYPKISDDPANELWNRIEKGIENREINNFDEDKKKQYLDRIKTEFDIFVQMGMCDYILLLHNIILFCIKNNISVAPRGSCNGSQTLWALEITDIDSIKFGLHFFRFVNPDRISLGDVDIDMAGSKRPMVKDFLYNYEGINGCAIITYQTLALKGACRLVAKGLGYSLDIENMVAKDIEEIKEEQEDGSEKIISTFHNKEKWEKEYPEWINLTYDALGIISASSTHACGFVATDRSLYEELGIFTDGKAPWIISQNDMKAIDSINFVKMDFLVVDNVQIVEDTCRLANIPPLKNDHLDLEDDNIWNEMERSGLGIFQFEKSGWYSLKKALENYKIFVKNNPKITRYFIMLALNGIIRPACASFREEFLLGKPYDNGHKSINEFFAEMNNYCIFQEQIMMFLEKFCHYTGAQSDGVRKGIAKKGGTEKFLPEIKKSFLKHFPSEYGVDLKRSDKIIDGFTKVVENAKDYGFSTNHSCPYTLLGIKGGYLRYYYPLEYLTVQLNINDGKKEKTANIISYINEFTNITIHEPKFRYSRGEYSIDKQNNAIYKGINSIKECNGNVADEIYELRNKNYDTFTELLVEMVETIPKINKKQIDALINIDYFSEFGKPLKLMNTYLKFIERYKKAHIDKTKAKRIEEIIEYERQLENLDFDIKEKLNLELEYFGYVRYISGLEQDRPKIFILDIDGKNKMSLEGYSIGSGKQTRYRIYRNIIGEKTKGDIIEIEKVKKIPKVYKTEDGFADHPTDTEWLIERIKIGG
jgi:DNA polymerase-3 subunit alpha